MSQKIQEINIADLVLWTENPRDSIDPNSTDQDIASRAWDNDQEKWNLLKLAKEMRSHYDLSELPTVVYHDQKPIVYDGNRRMILAKIKHNCVTLTNFEKSKPPLAPRLPKPKCPFPKRYLPHPNPLMRSREASGLVTAIRVGCADKRTARSHKHHQTHPINHHPGLFSKTIRCSTYPDTSLTYSNTSTGPSNRSLM